MKLLDFFKRNDWVSGRPDFTGKTLAVYCNSEERGGMLQDAKLVRLGFNKFLVGRLVVSEAKRESWSNVTVWIAVHDIAQLMVFDNVEAARRAFQPAEKDDSQQRNLGARA
jgi:hypothetical protein